MRRVTPPPQPDMTSSTPADKHRTEPAKVTSRGSSRVVVIGGGLAGARLAQRLGGRRHHRPHRGGAAHAPYNRVLLAEVLAGRYGPEVIALPPARGTSVRAPAPSGSTATDRRVTVRRRQRRPVRHARAGHRLQPGAAAAARPLRARRGRTAAAACTPSAPWTTAWPCPRRCGRAPAPSSSAAGCSACRRPARWPCAAPRSCWPSRASASWSASSTRTRAALLRRHLTALGVEVHTECRVRGRARSRGRRPVRARGARRRLRTGRRAHRPGLRRPAPHRARPGRRTRRPPGHRRGRRAAHLRPAHPRHRRLRRARRDGCTGWRRPALEQADALARGPDPPRRPRRLRGHPRPHPSHPRAPRGPRRPVALAAVRPARPGGLRRPHARPGDDVVRLADATRGTYRKVVVRGDRLVGGVLLGDLAAVGALARAWEDDEPLPADDSPLLHLLTNDGGF